MSGMLKKYTYYGGSVIRLITGIRDWPLVVRVFLGVAPPEQPVIHLRQSGVKFRVRGPMDIWSVKETFLDRFYQRFGTPLAEGWKVIDIGAGIGEFTLFAALGHPSSLVYAFEPFAESYALLQDNLELNRVSNVQIFPQAIGAQTGSLILDLSGGEPLQLQSQDLQSGKIPENARVVHSLSLADAFDRLGLERCNLLKLDCEGAEYPILFGAPRTVLERVERIVMEYHDGVSRHTHRELAAFLQAEGFEVAVQPNFVHADLGYLYAHR